MAQETFRTIEGFTDYQISDMGRVISNKGNNPKLLKPQKDKMGYFHFRLYDEAMPNIFYDNGTKKPKLEKLHKLVAMHFIDKPDTDDILEVNHKDGNKSNNKVHNLEWVTRKENIRHAHRTGLMGNGIRNGALKRSKSVKITFLDGRIELYPSITYAMLALKTTPATIKNKTLSGSYGKLGWRAELLELIPAELYYRKIEDVETLLQKYYDKYYKRKS